jgi:hypothetical protein
MAKPHRENLSRSRKTKNSIIALLVGRWETRYWLQILLHELYLLLLLLLLLVITFVQGIYSYMSGANLVSRVHNVIFL